MCVCFKTCNVHLNLIIGYELHSSVSLIIPSMPTTGAIVGQDSCASFAIHCIVALKVKLTLKMLAFSLYVGIDVGSPPPARIPRLRKVSFLFGNHKLENCVYRWVG